MIRELGIGVLSHKEAVWSKEQKSAKDLSSELNMESQDFRANLELIMFTNGADCVHKRELYKNACIRHGKPSFSAQRAYIPFQALEDLHEQT